MGTPHVHTDSCYSEIRGDLICGMEETDGHTHSESCYDAEGNLICQLEETPAHHHDETRYAHQRTLTCGLTEVRKHIHTDSCFVTEPPHEALTCTKPEHTHTAACFSDPDAGADLVSQRLRTFRASKTAASSPTGADVDMTNMIELATIERWNPDTGKWETPEGNVYNENDQIRCYIKYRVEGKSLNQDRDTRIYQAPVGVKLNAKEQGEVYNSSSQVVGTYTIDSNSKIQIRFNSDYIQQSPDGTVMEGYIRFEGSLDQSKADENGKLTVIFNEKCKIDLQIEETKPASGNIHVVKEADTKRVSGMVVYKITISSNQDTGSTVILTDTMTNAEYFSDLKVVDQNGNSVAVSSMPQPGDHNFQLELPAMTPNSKYVITYLAKSSLNASGQNLVNKAVAKSTDTEDAAIEDVDNVGIPYNMLSKEGTFDASNQTISWTIHVNPEKQDISGWQLQDRIFTLATAWPPRGRFHRSGGHRRIPSPAEARRHHPL